MITIHTHEVPGSKNELKITATDEPGSGGGHHRYCIEGFNSIDNSSCLYGDSIKRCVVVFQNGPIPTNGVNGITIETLLAICGHRLECFQAGPFACNDNQEALDHIRKAMECLQRRTKDRIARQVEGKEVL